MSLEDVFNAAADRVKEEKSMSNNNMLALYGLFKQAKVGDVNTERPGGILSQKDKYKWDAWQSEKGKSKEDAMRAYIAKVDELCSTEFVKRA